MEFHEIPDAVRTSHTTEESVEFKTVLYRISKLTGEDRVFHIAHMFSIDEALERLIYA